jgi:hypothetical protein
MNFQSESAEGEIIRNRWQDSVKFGYKASGCGMSLSGSVIVQVTDSFEHGKI